MEKQWHFTLNGEYHKVTVDSNWINRRSFYFDGQRIHKESFFEPYGNEFQRLKEGKFIISRFEINGFDFVIREEDFWRSKLKLYIDGKDAELVTKFDNKAYSQQYNAEYTPSNESTSRLNAHAWSKDVIVPIVVALLGGGGIFGLIKGYQELTRSEPTVEAQETTATAQKNNSVCRLQPGAYKASVTRELGLGLREKPQEDDTIRKRINLNQEIIVLKKNKDGNWLYVCLEGTNTRGWVIGKYTKKL